MKWIATIAGALLFAFLATEPADAQSSRDGYVTIAPAKPKRARTKIVVRPRYPYRTTHSLYPPPYDIEYPGPNAHRECTGGFATEYRASGPVVVPRMRCWWAAGSYPGP
jgi:hypothetical protein